MTNHKEYSKKYAEEHKEEIKIYKKKYRLLHKEEIITEIEGISLDLSNLDIEIKRILGLTQENFRITSTTYNAAGLLTSATTKIYPTKADCDADTNPIATYLLTAVYDAENNCTSYKMTKES